MRQQHAPAQPAAPPERSGKGLRGVALRGARAGGLAGIAQQSLSIVATLILTRLLVPDEFGLIAATTTAVALVKLFSQFGLSAVIVRTEHLTRDDLNTISWTVIGLAVLLGVGGAVGAPLLSALSGIENAAPLIAALSVASCFSVITTIPRAILLRSLRPELVYSLDVAEMIVYSLAPVLLVAVGMGVWGVILGQCASFVVALIAFSVTARWFPGFSYSRSSLRHLAHFGSRMASNSWLLYLSRNLDYWVVGHTLGAAVLGVYYVAYVLPNILRQRITWMSSEILLTVYSRISADTARLSDAYVQALRAHAAVGAALMTAIASGSPLIVALCFGDEWAAAATPLSIIGVAALLDLLNSPGSALFIAVGKPGLITRTVLVRLAVLSLGLGVCLAEVSLLGVALAVLVSSAAASLMNQVLVRHATIVTWSQTVRALYPAALAAGVMWCVMELVRRNALTGLGDLPALLLVGSLGLAVYVAIYWLIARDHVVAIVRDGKSMFGAKSP